ncbi:MAG TPA: hypothetical protein ENI70_01995, partial [Candidatus Peregrinibacteria bacterium]|nr:hypothetical protein [Candidatus Peregrinibacteria bacterium]
MPPQKKKSPRRKVKKASSKKKKIIKKEISPKGYSGWWIFFSLVFCFFFVSAVLAVYFYPDVYRYAEENENDSASELLRKNVFHVNGKTYVAYREPVVGLTLVHDSNCTSCDLGGLIRLAKAAVPTAQVKILDSSGPGAQKLIQDFELKALPAAFFSQTLSQTSFYKPLEKDLVEKGDYYFFNLGQEIGIRSELSELIDVESGEDWKIETTFSQDFLEEPFRGDEDADVVIVSYSDFECPFCA